MNNVRANVGEWEWIDPSRIEAVCDLVTEAHRALESKAASSWGAGQRKAVEDTLDRARALMRELARLAEHSESAELAAGSSAAALERDDRSGSPTPSPPR